MSTKIEWTDETWNPIIGCSRVGEGCDHCYAVGVVGRQMSPQHVGMTTKTDAGLDWTGQVRFVPQVLDKPLHWKRPRRIFVNSLSDLFHADLADEDIAQVFSVMARAPQHTFQVLTKRPQRMAEWLARCEPIEAFVTHNGQKPSKGGIVVGEPGRWPLPNVWLGTSIELDKYAFRADHLRRTLAAVRFISAEPLLGPLPSLDLTGIDWVIAGGESGHGARPMHPDWVRDLRDRCQPAPLEDRIHAAFTAQVLQPMPPALRPRPAFLFKQWGDWGPTGAVGMGVALSRAGREVLVGDPDEHGCQTVLARLGKKHTGRELDGRTYDEYPAAAS